MVRRVVISSSAVDTQGNLALMLCEALLHVLVERKVIRRSDALEAIDSVAELMAELDNPSGRRPRAPGTKATREAIGMIKKIRASFAAKS